MLMRALLSAGAEVRFQRVGHNLAGAGLGVSPNIVGSPAVPAYSSSIPDPSSPRLPGITIPFPPGRGQRLTSQLH